MEAERGDPLSSKRLSLGRPPALDGLIMGCSVSEVTGEMLHTELGQQGMYKGECDRHVVLFFFFFDYTENSKSTKLSLDLF